MLQEAMAKIQAMAQEAQTAQIVHLNGDPPHTNYLYDPQAHALTFLGRSAPDHRVELMTFKSLLDLARTHYDDSLSPPSPVGRVIFCSRSRIELIYDVRNGFDRAILYLRPTEELVWFGLRRKDPRLTVKEFRENLMTVLHATVPTGSDLLERISGLNASSTAEKKAVLSRSQESMGQTITSQLQGDYEKNLPADLQTFSVRPYQTLDLSFRVPMKCHLTVDLAQMVWSIQPTYQSWLEYAAATHEHVMGLLTKGLEGTGVRCFSGQFDDLADPANIL